MTTVPPPNVALPQVLAAAAAAPTIVIPQPPPAIAALPVGTTIEAMVLPPPPAPIPAAPTAPAQQAVVLHTAVGDIAVRLPIALPERVQVDLEVVRATPQQVTVRITTVDGTATAQYLAQSRVPISTPAPPSTLTLPQTQILPGPQPLPLAASWMPSGPAPFVQAGTISAVITQAPTMGEAAPNAAPSWPAPSAPAPAPPAAPAPPGAPAPPPTLASLPVGTGSELALKIVSVQLPNAAPVAAPPQPVQTPVPPPPAPATPSAPPVAAPAAPTLTPPPPQPGLVLTSAQPAALPQPPGTVQAAPPLATVTGTVIAIADSIPVVEIEERQVQLNVRANLPLGTKIVFEVAAATPPRIGAALPLPLPASAPPMAGPAGAYTGWPTLIESISVLQRSDPVAAQQLAQVIPDGGPRTAAAVISFVQAMRTGDARQWPGDTTLRALEKAGPRGAHLAGTLSGEVGELSARARDAGGGEWRALPVPWNAGGQIERIALITRREGDADSEGGGGKKGGGTRFLIDLNLSRLGSMQLDGMFKKELRAFDMVLRTKEALPEEMRRDLLGIFTSANGAMGLKGGLTFQVTKKFADPFNAGNSPDKAGFWA